MINTSLQPGQAAKDYQTRIKEFFKEGDHLFDLVLLGTGNDGHTLSLFPDTPVLSEQVELVRAVYPKDLEPRVTLTIPAVARSLNAAYLVTGKEKSSFHTGSKVSGL